MKIRFYISEIDELNNFSKIKKNFECIINAALIAKEYNNKCAAYKLLGDTYEIVIKHLKKTVKKFDHRAKYKLVKKINQYTTVEQLAKTYHYKNLKLERFLIEPD